MENQNNNPNLSPTVPNGDIFNSQPIAPMPTQAPPPVDKKDIVARHRKFPGGIILGLIGIVVLLLIVMLIAKVVASRKTGTEQASLVWWSIEEDAEAVAPIISEYEQQHPDVKIQFVSQSKQDYADRLANALARGTGPDIFEFHNSWVPMFGKNLLPTKEDFSSSFYSVVAADLKTKNGFVGIPLEYDGIALFVNNDILNTYGRNPPKTWDDFRSLAQTLTIRDKNGTIAQSGASIGVTTNVDYWQDILALLIYQNGGDLTNPSSVAGQSALTFYTNFSKKDNVWDASLPTSTLDFATGHLAMYFGKYSDAFNIAKQNPSLHFEVVPLPQLPTNEASIPSVSYASYWVNGVSAKSINSAVAWDFLKFMSNKQVLTELYNNEKKIRGYGNLYPRVDMQQELLSDTLAGPFVYQANFAKSWYLAGNTFDGLTGINSQVAKPYANVVDSFNGNNGGSDLILKGLQANLALILSTYGLVPKPISTP